ncbi:MAG: CHASE2 domain-containing protein [Thermostichales cyanobacterium SZTDM-1c_bins_54]
MKHWRWGLGWGLGWGLVMALSATSPMFYQWENLALRWGLSWRSPQKPDPHLRVIGIDGDGMGFRLERGNYAELTASLLDAGAAVVVLNLPSSFLTPQRVGNENLDAPLQELLVRYPERLVLATRISESLGQKEFPIYNHFLTYTPDSLAPVVPPEFVQGFVQYQLDDAGQIRIAQLRQTFIRQDSKVPQTFASVEALALLKFRPTLAADLFRQGAKPFFFNPLTPQPGIPMLTVEEVCGGDPCGQVLGLREQLQGKVVLVGFVGGYPETFPVRLVTGEMVPAVVVQAQILSSLLQGQAYRVLPGPGRAVLLVLLGVGTGLGVVAAKRWWHLLLGGLLLGGSYTAWMLAQVLWGWWIWPLVIPGVVAGATLGCTALTGILLRNRERLLSQQQELERLRQAEQEAIIDQARKLLYRVATDIHDQELQELKLAMDSIEAWQWQQAQGQPIPAKAYDQLLEQLQAIGQGIRDQLNDVRTLADKLRISPALKAGLHEGIRAYVRECQASGSLTLPVMLEIEPLQESSSREWLDAREDIIRFLREALNNVIHHVQPPKGTATFVRICLSQSGSRCCLQVINDGVSTGSVRKGGAGTKAMNTIARDLPQGSWQRRYHQGLVEVELHWQMP